MLNIVFTPEGPKDPLLRRQYSNFIRLVDFSVNQYELTRHHLDAVIVDREASLGHMWSSMDYLEVCVVTTHRALNSLNSISRHKGASTIPRAIRRLLQTFDNNTLRNIRDAIMHVEKDINAGIIETGESHALQTTEDGRTATIGEHSIVLEELANVISSLHNLAKQISEYREKIT